MRYGTSALAVAQVKTSSEKKRLYMRLAHLRYKRLAHTHAPGVCSGTEAGNALTKREGRMVNLTSKPENSIDARLSRWSTRPRDG